MIQKPILRLAAVACFVLVAACQDTTPPTDPSDADLTEEEREIVAALKQWRKDKASALNIPDFFICHNAELMSISKLKPRKLDELNQVRGFGSQKIARHGEEIISVINAF